MPHFDTSTMRWMTTDWFPSKTNQQIARLTPTELRDALDCIEGRFEAHVADPRLPVGVALNFPGEWPPDLEPLWSKCCLGLEDEAAMLAGNLYCRVAIRRKEKWWSFPDTRLSHKPRKYLLDTDLLSAAFGI